MKQSNKYVVAKAMLSAFAVGALFIIELDYIRREAGTLMLVLNGVFLLINGLNAFAYGLQAQNEVDYAEDKRKEVV